MFDWTQCSTSGLIRAIGKQHLASVASVVCIACISMPISSLLLFKYGWGIEGLWVGYGLCHLTLTLLYYLILVCIDWKAAAMWAATNEE